MKNRTINLYTEWKPLIDALTDSEAGLLLKDIFNYQSGIDVKNSSPVWFFIKSKIDDYNEIGKAISNVRRDSVNKRWEKHDTNEYNSIQMNTNDTIKEEKRKEKKTKENLIKEESNKRERFQKPTTDEIKQYCLERNNSIDPERFFDYYEARGWKTGNSPIKEWKACVRTWERREKKEEVDYDKF